MNLAMFIDLAYACKICVHTNRIDLLDARADPNAVDYNVRHASTHAHAPVHIHIRAHTYALKTRTHSQMYTNTYTHSHSRLT